MRRRGRTINYGARLPARPHSIPGSSATYPEGRPFVISQVPEEWRRYALEPWRIMFPDLDWKPPEVE